MKYSKKGAEVESELKKQGLADGKKPDTSKAELDLTKMSYPRRDDQYGVPCGIPHETQKLQLCFRPVLPPGQEEQRVQPGRLNVQC